MLYPRVQLPTAILNPGILAALIRYLAAPALLAAIAAGPEDSPRNPLQLTAGLQMALLFQVVLMAVFIP
jgi:hypothetical protein